MTQKELATSVNAKPQDVSGHLIESIVLQRLTITGRLLISSLDELSLTKLFWASWRGSSMSSCVGPRILSVHLFIPKRSK